MDDVFYVNRKTTNHLQMTPKMGCSTSSWLSESGIQLVINVGPCIDYFTMSEGCPQDLKATGLLRLSLHVLQALYNMGQLSLACMCIVF